MGGKTEVEVMDWIIDLETKMRNLFFTFSAKKRTTLAL